MMPAPGLIAFVLSPVSQFAVAEKPMAKVQDSVVQVFPTFGPISTF
jgi:hypothetical protein